MRRKTALIIIASALAVVATQFLAQAQTVAAAPGGAGGRGGGGGFGGFGGGGRGAATPWIEQGYNDHQNMMDQLGIKSLRPGKSGNNQTGPGFEEATANDWMSTMPDALMLNSAVKPSNWWNLWGTFPWGSPTKKVTTAKMWWTKRRPEILEDFEREVYGRIPANVPKVTWEVTGTTEGESGGVPTITKTLVGHVDNSAFTNITVNIQASFTVPAKAPGPVPVLIQFGGGFGGGFGGAGGFGGGFGGALTADQTTKLNAGVTTAQADLTALQEKLAAAQKDAVAAALAKEDDASVQAKLEAIGKIQTDIAMLRYDKGVSVIAPSITEAQKTTISTTPGPIYTTFFAAAPTAPARGGGRGAPGGGGAGGGIPQEALSHGWGYGSINPGSIQADSGGNSLREGIIGLANKGKPRTPEQWGALRAWGWGVGRLVDYFEAHPDSKVDPTKVGIEGVSRYGKAALVTEAFEPRVAVALVGSSGEGGAKLHRHNYGEAVENLTGDEYYWMAGNFLKYGASDINGKSLNASDLPVDSHELIALCAPRPCFISDGSESGGDPKWIDHPGTYRAGILASKVYELLGKKGYGDDITDWIHAPLPPVETLVGGDLAFRQHSGGHTDGPNIPTFFNWVGSYIKSPAAPGQPPK